MTTPEMLSCDDACAAALEACDIPGARILTIVPHPAVLHDLWERLLRAAEDRKMIRPLICNVTKRWLWKNKATIRFLSQDNGEIGRGMGLHLGWLYCPEAYTEQNYRTALDVLHHYVREGDNPRIIGSDDGRDRP